jgi:hypothetical protein
LSEKQSPIQSDKKASCHPKGRSAKTHSVKRLRVQRVVQMSWELQQKDWKETSQKQVRRRLQTVMSESLLLPHQTVPMLEEEQCSELVQERILEHQHRQELDCPSTTAV